MILLRLGFRNLRRNRRRTAMTLIALVLGVAIMVLLNGFVNAIKSIETSGTVYGQIGALQVHKAGYFKNIYGNPLQLDFADSADLRQKILAVGGVENLSPRIHFSGIFSLPEVTGNGVEAGKSIYFSATAFDPEMEKKVCPEFFKWIVDGRMLSGNGTAEILLSTELADGVTLMPRGAEALPVDQWPALIAMDRDGSANGEPALAVGKLGNALPGDRRVGFTTLGLAQRVLRMEGRITEYAVGIRDLDKISSVKKRLEKALGSEFEVQSWDEVMPFIEGQRAIMDLIYNVVTTIFLIVVLLGVVNAMFMSVLERTTEIGTLISLGFKRKNVVQLFIFEGVFLGVLGGVVGVLIGVIAVLVSARVGITISAPGSEIPFVLHPFVTPLFLLRVFVSASVGSAIATLLPARRASLLRPVEALSHA